MRYLVLFLFLALAIGCDSNPSHKKSIFILAVENLSFNDITCEPENLSLEGEGIQNFCQESIRFTHAYTPSTQSQATLASLLTGLYPEEHQVRHNGSDYLKANFETAAELAVKRSYLTTFFSAGAPIWRKSGLNQGFELFNDQVDTNLNGSYRPAQVNFKLLLEWLNNHQKQPSFNVIHFSDLLYPHVTTKNNQNEIRNNTRLSQILEFSESLNEFIVKLKSLNLYENSYIILVGLNGNIALPIANELPPVSLHSDNMQVSLLIKPPRGARDLSINWKVDANVSLVDLGATLFDILKSSKPRLSLYGQTTSLLSAINDNVINWNKDRLIHTQSAWAQWKFNKNVRHGFVKNQFVFTYDKNIKIYNSYVDKLETQPLNNDSPLAQELILQAKNFYTERHIEPWDGLSPFEIETVKNIQSAFKPSPDPESLFNFQQISKSHPENKELKNRLALLFLQHQKWSALESLGNEIGDSNLVYIAQKNQNKTPLGKPEGCLKYLSRLTDRKSFAFKSCNDKLFIQLFRTLRDNDNPSLYKDFFRNYRIEKSNEATARANFLHYNPWSLNQNILSGPTATELALALPENSNFQKKLQKDLAFAITTTK